MRVLALLAFLGLTSPIGSLAVEVICDPSKTGCKLISRWNDKSAILQTQVQLQEVTQEQLQADAVDDSSAVESTNSSSAAQCKLFDGKYCSATPNQNLPQAHGRSGGEVSRFYGVTSAAACSDKCSDYVPGCTHYTYTTTYGDCLLFDTCPAGKTYSDGNQGTETFSLAPCQAQCKLFDGKYCSATPNQNLPLAHGGSGGEVSRIYGVTSAAACSDKCSDYVPGCTHYTYTTTYGDCLLFDTCPAGKTYIVGGGHGTETFSLAPCQVAAPQNCVGLWAGWTTCTRTCGGGTQSRSFTVRQHPAYGGSSCPSSQSQSCNSFACPVDCVGSLGAWSTCSRPCGGGAQSRSYVITTPRANGGRQCPPPESQLCSTTPCPVNCAGSWNSWGSCSQECGGGMQNRTFTVTAAPAHGGTACPVAESQQCSSSPCPVHCQGSFGAWGACSESCGGGTQSRTFSITSQASMGGDDCPASPESQPCNSRECPVDCAGSWLEWGQCSLKCAGGTRTRIFTVATQHGHDGIACPTSPDSQECNAHICPVDCDGSWQEWGACSLSCGCGGGTQSAAFNVSVPPADGGEACPSPRTQVCNDHSCPENCAGSWGPWSLCSQECGGGSQTRTFSTTFEATFGGADCPASPESQPCNSQECPNTTPTTTTTTTTTVTPATAEPCFGPWCRR